MVTQEIFSEILRELRELNGKLTSIEDLLVKHEKKSPYCSGADGLLSERPPTDC